MDRDSASLRRAQRRLSDAVPFSLVDGHAAMIDAVAELA